LTAFDAVRRAHLVLLLEMIRKSEIDARSPLSGVPMNFLGSNVGPGDATTYILTIGDCAKYCQRLGLNPVDVFSEAVNAPGPKPLQRGVAQDRAILDAITARGLDPLNFPASPQGKRGAKAELRNALLLSRSDLFQSSGVFDRSWERLAKRKEIANEDTLP
jgi:hypothetical protein